MPSLSAEPAVVVIGAGAAGLAATRCLVEAGVGVVLIEARSRIGGRSHTLVADDLPIDLGCGWLHSGDENPWTAIAPTLGLSVDRTPAPWENDRNQIGFDQEARDGFRAAMGHFWEALDVAAEGPDRPAAELLEPGGRWNGLVEAVSTYVNGIELDQVSIHDLARYHDSGRNWRVTAGYGALIARYGADLPVTLDCPATRVDHRDAAIRIDTPRGTLRTGAVIVAVPTNVLAAGTIAFEPDLPTVREAAVGLPLGYAEKVFFRLDGAEEFAPDSRFYGATDRAATGAYHLRSLGRPVIECYFGGHLARDLQAAGADAMAAFASDEIAGTLGAGLRPRLQRLATSAWASDPWARGSYSHALPGRAEARAVLAASIDDRLFFAGEACSPADFSTAHGAYETGLAAAAAVLAAR